ncbi:putative hydrolase [Tripterygium wilfordii]|uniref:Putative hydrolase n=1 Tax=Tripterygium wilfordii TaxID=458696 RepID=A0A7J7CEN5_TRIWF|nr:PLASMODESMATA CALLOSE-BINDING PROTEIN 5-like [Tripterygium wilfordii]KAF5732599.1 putative hydrolase [Tripterygium wilfordii]
MSVNFSVFLFWVFFSGLHVSLGADNGGVAALELWCVAKNNAEDQAIQQSLDWACGQGGADCGPIQQGGPCYDPKDLPKTASFAFNDYYAKNGRTDDACDFSNTAALTSLNPSYGNCRFPSSSTVKNGNISDTTGIGPDHSADLSGTDPIAHTWFWSVFIVHIMFLFTWLIEVH